MNKMIMETELEYSDYVNRLLIFLFIFFYSFFIIPILISTENLYVSTIITIFYINIFGIIYIFFIVKKVFKRSAPLKIIIYSDRIERIKDSIYKKIIYFDEIYKVVINKKGTYIHIYYKKNKTDYRWRLESSIFRLKVDNEKIRKITDIVADVARKKGIKIVEK